MFDIHRDSSTEDYLCEQFAINTNTKRQINILNDKQTSYEFVRFFFASNRHKTECSNTSFANKLIVLDEFDGHSNFAPFKNKAERQKHYPVVDDRAIWKFLFFKRSYVKRHDGIFQGFPHLKKPDVYPLTYSIMESYIQSPMSRQRDIDILCTLRGSQQMPTRMRVQTSVQKYIDANPEDVMRLCDVIVM